MESVEGKSRLQGDLLNESNNLKLINKLNLNNTSDYWRDFDADPFNFERGSGSARKAELRLSFVADFRLHCLFILCGWCGMKTAFLLGHSLTKRQETPLVFIDEATPYYSPLTQPLRVIDAQALSDALGFLYFRENWNVLYITIDGKRMRARKTSEDKAEYIFSILRWLV